MLDVSDAARRLGVSPDTVERWIRQGKIPAHRDRGTWVFDPDEIRRWARTNGLQFSPGENGGGHERKVETVTVAEALRRGGVARGVEAQNVSEVLRALVARSPLPEEHHATLLEGLEEREALSSTGIGHGIAVPHPRNPLEGIVEESSITCCCLATPVSFGSLDGEPVSVAFLLLSPSVKAHLPLLSRLAFCLSRPDVVALVADGCAGIDSLIETIAAVEAGIRR